MSRIPDYGTPCPADRAATLTARELRDFSPEEIAAGSTPREQRRLVTFARAGDMQAKKIPELVAGLLYENTCAAIVGPSGACKTFAAIDLVFCVATGLPYHGRNVKQGAAFYIGAEGMSGLRNRLAGLERHHGHPLGKAPLFIADCLPFLCDDMNAAEVVQAVQDVADAVLFEADAPEPVLIVIDTVARAMNGANENSAEDMGQFVKAMDWLRTTWGATVLAIHHCGHENGERARGSSAFYAALDTELLMRNVDSQVTMRTTKAKDWTPGPPITFRKVPVEIAVPSVDVEGVPVSVPETTLVLVDDAGAAVAQSKRDTVEWYAANGYGKRATARETRIPLTTVNRLWPKPSDTS